MGYSETIKEINRGTNLACYYGEHDSKHGE
jgi:hypothetical protein